jgi:hypothetical protein
VNEIKVIVGGGLEEDTDAFLDAWRRAERGERVIVVEGDPGMVVQELFFRRAKNF